MDVFSHLKEYLNQADLLRNGEQNMSWYFWNDADKSRFFLRILQELQGSKGDKPVKLLLIWFQLLN